MTTQKSSINATTTYIHIHIHDDQRIPRVSRNDVVSMLFVFIHLDEPECFGSYFVSGDPPFSLCLCLFRTPREIRRITLVKHRTEKRGAKGAPKEKKRNVDHVLMPLRCVLFRPIMASSLFDSKHPLLPIPSNPPIARLSHKTELGVGTKKTRIYNSASASLT